jgi:hypothetical protein
LIRRNDQAEGCETETGREEALGLGSERTDGRRIHLDLPHVEAGLADEGHEDDGGPVRQSGNSAG